MGNRLVDAIGGTGTVVNWQKVSLWRLRRQVEFQPARTGRTCSFLHDARERWRIPIK